MMRKCLVWFAAFTIGASLASAESMRPLLTKENKMPELHKAEVGVLGIYKEIPEDFDKGVYVKRDEYTETPYVRYGLVENLTLVATVPFKQVQPKVGDDQSGLSDVSIGAELMAFQDIFDYPWIMPHADISFQTGDEDKGLGAGENIVTVGAALGTTVADVWHYAADLTYELHDNTDDVAGGALSLTWDLNERFSVLGEGKMTNEEQGNFKNPIYYDVGMCYKATEALAFNVYGGGATDAEEHTIIGVKGAYSF